MNKHELEVWIAETESSRFQWCEDEIYRLNGRGSMYYTGGEDGIYMRIGKDGTLEAGHYKGAIPHIGEAFFQPDVVKQYNNYSQALTAAMEAGGKQFLVDMLSAGKSSVIDQLSAAHEPPPMPRKQTETVEPPSIKTVIVNLYAGPGAGKTTCAWEIASRLKKENINTEYVSEYAKELVWEGNNQLLDGSYKNQLHLFTEQNWRLERLVGKVEVVVTDSPILLSLIYCKESSPKLEAMVLEAYRGYNNFNLFINRGEGFEQAGRIHTLGESCAIDKKIHAMLKGYGIYYGIYDRNNTDTIIANIKRSMKYNQTYLATPPRPVRPKPCPPNRGR